MYVLIFARVDCLTDVTGIITLLVSAEYFHL